MISLFIIVIALAIVAICAAVLSSRISREEERNEGDT